MKIALDINGILAPSGLGIYIRMLVKALAEADRANEYLLYLHQWSRPDRDRLSEVLPKAPNFSLFSPRVPDLPLMAAEHLLGLPATEMLMKGRGIDVFHGPANLLPETSAFATVLTLHHYIAPGHEFFPEDLPWRQKFYFRASDNSIRRATRVITDSFHSKADIEAAIKLPAGRVSVLPGGEPEIKPPAEGEAERVRAKYRLPAAFSLFSGPLNERKNLGGFLKAFAASGAASSGLGLVVTGSGGPEFTAGIRSLVRSLGIGDKVVFTGIVDAADLPGLYAAAEFLSYPSLFEGFGYPPLEAMVCGCPVLAAAVTSIPEVVGDAALMLDPRDQASMSAAIDRMHGDPELRRALVEKGRARAAGFSWRRTASETVKIYRDAFESRR